MNAREQRAAQLAAMRNARRQREEERRQAQLNPGRAANGAGRSRAVPGAIPPADDLDEFLIECGIDSTPNLRSTPARTAGQEHSLPGGQPHAAKTTVDSFVQTVASPPNVSYSKTTQTNEERMDEFSDGSQELEYDDGDLRACSMDGSRVDDGGITDLPGFSSTVGVPHQEDQKTQQLPDLSEEEKKQIMTSSGFVNFFDYSSKVMMRALAEDWTAGRTVIGISFSEMHPELAAVGYDELPEASDEPKGVVVVWNTKFKKPSPEFVFHCYSRLTSVAFARFQPHLIIGGCYSGQLVLWDFRPDKHNVYRKTPISKSPLSVSAHTHPVYSLAVVGSSNAHNIVSVSTDGKLCAWNMDTLSQPVEGSGKELVGKRAKPVAVLCMAFPPNDVNNLIVAGEDGGAYFISRHGGSCADKMFEAHSAPVSGASFHPPIGPIDFSHVFLTSSMDWTIKLWSLKDPKLRLSLEAHVDYVYDVAWSPTHPAVFASIDAVGNLFLWNLNEDVEGPVARLRLTRGGTGGGEEGTECSGAAAPLVLRKLSWSANGAHLLVGGADGDVRMLDVHEQMHTNVRSEEWGKFASMLADVRQTVDDAGEQSDDSGFGVPGQSTAAALVAGSSPRSLY